MELRGYQSDAIGRMRALMLRGDRAVCLRAPCGAGKTVIAAALIDMALAKGSRCLFLAHRKELIEQAAERLEAYGVKRWHVGIAMGKHPRTFKRAPVQVASIDTLVNRLETWPMDFALVIVDEAHHATANSYLKVLDACGGARVVGLTATPYRADGECLGDLFDGLVEVVSERELIADGSAVPTRVFLASRSADLSKVKVARGDYATGALERAVDTPDLRGDIVREWKRVASSRLTICFAAGVDHSKAIVDQFRAAGVAAAHVDAKTPQDERDRIFADLRAGRLRVVSNMGIATEGWDCPPVSCVILARPTKSRSLWKQMAGRGSRICPEIGKTDCILLDHAGATYEHGFVEDPENLELKRSEEKKADEPSKPKARRCMKCGLALERGAKECPECGWEVPPPPQPKGLRVDKSAALEELPAGDAAKEIWRMRETYSRLAAEAWTRNRKPGWAAHKFKDEFGMWPPKSVEAAATHRTRIVRVGGKGKLVWDSQATKRNIERQMAGAGI